jgi:hypothetical protein
MCKPLLEGAIPGLHDNEQSNGAIVHIFQDINFWLSSTPTPINPEQIGGFMRRRGDYGDNAFD